MVNPALAREVKNKLVDYMDAKPHRCINYLANKAGVAHSTVKRLVDGEGNYRSSTIVHVLKHIMTRNELLAFCFENNMPEKDAVAVLNEETHFLEAPIEDLLRDPFINEVVQLTSSESSACHVDDIPRILGERGQEALEVLVSKGFVTIHNSIAKFYKKSFNVSDIKTALRSVEFRISRFDTDNLGTDAAFLAELSEGVNTQGLAEVKKAELEFVEKVKMVFASQPGEHKLFTVLFSNLLDSRTFSRGE